jgi:23S rRNA pseudouridine1911/1915/1917 synthase
MARAQGCELEILHEDQDLLVLNKPSGLASAPLGIRSETETAVHHALAHAPALPLTDPKEPGLLHRLDTGTSGCLAFAKTREAFDFIKSAWRAGQVTKFYQAAVMNFPTGPLPQEIRLALGHDPKSSRKMKIAEGRIRGKTLEAWTSLLHAEPISVDGQTAVLLTIQLHTGVMHQIRVHLAHLGLPILGDALYGGRPSSRLWLHCASMHIPTPSGREVRVTALQKTFGRLPVS